MHGSAPWKTQETVVGLPRLLVFSVFSRSDSPDLVAVTFYPWWLSPFTFFTLPVTFLLPTSYRGLHHEKKPGIACGRSFPSVTPTPRSMRAGVWNFPVLPDPLSISHKISRC